MGDQPTQHAGLERNAQGRLYKRGREYSTAQKLEFEEIYWQMCAENDGDPPGLRKFARKIKVGTSFAKKMIDEITSNGTVKAVEELKDERWE